ncbi:hypothetical protein MNBD_GAMMA09-1471 [hydrothermal vent metagenome]|uniref:Uncharacterized protein n=1 Tax=hydrothermal vent metagenome TaxID=652676 RepID=A0A3B0Y371_9ZZZZ
MMKYRSIMIVVFALSGQVVFAGSITDNYATGDALTVQILNNIKTAVNDNDTQISSFKSGIYSVSALVGIPRNTACPTNQQSVGGNNVGRSADDVNCGQDALLAPVSLPDGATITAFRCTVYDADNARDSSCFLINDLVAVMAQVSTTGSSGIQTVATTNINGAVIDNSSSSYIVAMDIDGSAITTLVPIRAVIEYTLP